MLQIALLGTNKPPIWLVESRYRLGKAAVCDIRLPDDTLLDVHLQLHVDGDCLTLQPASGALVLVNGMRATAGSSLNHGDRLKLGRTQLAIVDPKIAMQTEGSADGAVTTAQGEPLWVLQGLGTALSDKRYAINGTMVAGRSRECDLCLAVAHLSRQHARLTPDGKGLQVEDLGSANGTFINGKRIERGYLKNGDELRFDTVRFRVLGAGADTDPDKTKVRPIMQPVGAKRTSPTPAKQRAAPSLAVDSLVTAPSSAAETPGAGAGLSMRLGYIGFALLVIVGGIFWALGR